jgi:hypothetical protein
MLGGLYIVLHDNAPSVSEDLSRLLVLRKTSNQVDIDVLIKALKEDSVVLLQNVEADAVDNLMYVIAQGLGLVESLELQAAFASIHGHRFNIGKYFMSVNKRKEYRFVPPHSEGHRLANMQLASFFCFENSTDGGETILMNVDDSSDLWPSFREEVKKARLQSRVLSQRESLQARGQYHLNLPGDLVQDDDILLCEHETDIPGLLRLDVLSKPVRAYSKIAERSVYAYWDSISSIDFDSAAEFKSLLSVSGLLKEPPGGLDLSRIDSEAGRRLFHSGVKFSELFKGRITRKLQPGDLVIMNNLTWTHAANNWSPKSGIRNIAASFA